MNAEKASNAAGARVAFGLWLNWLARRSVNSAKPFARAPHLIYHL
jgi:hypothetical protein